MPKKQVQMNKILLLLCLLLPDMLTCTEEDILFEGEKFPAIIWHNPDGDFCLIYNSYIIVIDSWHFPEID